jgi:hypothetical protein
MNKYIIKKIIMAASTVYALSEKEKQFVRDNCTKMEVSNIAKALYKPQSEVYKVILQEKLSINVKIQRKGKIKV